MPARIPVLGTGWSFPPTFVKGPNTVEMISDEEDVNSSLHILLSTGIGERVMRPTYGCDLKQFLFEPLDTSLQAYVKDIIITAVLYHEPRIRLDDVTIARNAEQGMIEINVQYTVKTTNSRFNLVYPFYLREATEVREL